MKNKFCSFTGWWNRSPVSSRQKYRNRSRE